MPIIYTDVPVTEKKVTGFECNKCKITYRLSNDPLELEEMVHLKKTGGYGSVWGDGTTVEVSLCQYCAKEMFNDIATIHPPKI